ncbi:MAG: DmsE family decaheme c-type cytochrome [Betaproteobacteria bacterium]|nr:DmsE family decaheme c-type cytochrome [Betaproteobacteria bacterium]
MKRLRQILLGWMMIGAWMAAGSAWSADDEAKDLVLRGDSRCTACHEPGEFPQLFPIGKTRHGTMADARTPSCTNCHGETQKHSEGQGTPDITYGHQTEAGVKNGACLGCHKRDAKRSHWEGSTHQARNVACTSCHKIHSATDPVRDKRTQAEVCYKCHKEQRAQASRPSHHPVPEGKMGCSDCHNVHGSVGPKLMKRDSVVETCYTCHMEKRGPFVHSHEPVNDDCTHCHNPHGTTAESMLKVRPPFLCHQCHTPHVPAQASLYGQLPTPNSIGWNGASVVQGRGCLNCHTQIHGSNNPSATNPTPQFLFR